MSIVPSSLRGLAAPVLAVLVAVAGRPAAQGEARSESSGPYPSHDFRSADPDGPAFRVIYDAVGASVRRIELPDHASQTDRGEAAEGAAPPYALVIEEFVDPANEREGVYGWLSLAAASGQAGLPDGLATLDRATWDVETAPDRLRFSLDVGDGHRIEKSFVYDDDGRRDLRVEIVLRATAEASDLRGQTWRFVLGGVGLHTPVSEAVYGKPAMAAAGLLLPDGDDEFVDEREFGGPIRQRLLASAQSGRIEFAGTTNRFFAALLYPADEDATAGLESVFVSTVPSRAQAEQEAFSVPVLDYGLALPVPAPGTATERSWRLYLGPKSFDVWNRRDEYDRFDPVLEEALNPGCYCSVPGSKTLGGALLWLMNFLHDLVGSWGFAIVCLTILVRSVMFPLNFRMQKSMRAYGAKMAKLKPKLDALQQRYANDKARLQQEMVAFQREHKLFPPVGGCLPIFLTMPIYIGLFSAIRVAYELRLQPFLFLDDLSQPDQLIPTGLGADSFFGAVNLLPLLYMVLMFYIMTRQPLPKDPQQRQVAQMTRFMPVIFGVLLYTYAAGMFVYMITSAAWTLVEQRVVKKVLGPVDPDAAGLGAQPMM